MIRDGMMVKMTKTQRSGNRRWMTSGVTGVTGVTRTGMENDTAGTLFKKMELEVDDRVSQRQAKVRKAPRMVACKE